MKTICIAGKNEIAVNALLFLNKNYPNNKYYVIPNRSDTGVTGWQPSLIFTAKLLKVEILSLKQVNDIEDLIFLSLEFDSIIKPTLFRSKALFNIHFSALPKYKGMFTSVFPLLHGEENSGVTLHKIDKGIDTGEIIDQTIFPLTQNTTCRELYQLYLDHAFQLFKKNIDSLINNYYTTSEQKAYGSSYYSKNSIDFSNVTIDLKKTAHQIHNQFRAFIFREYQLPTFKEWSIYKTEITNNKSIEKPSTILTQNDEYYLISSIDYDLKLFKDYYQQLWISCKEGDIKTSKSLIQYIPDITTRNKNGWSALIIAVYNNHPIIVQFLIDSYPKDVDFVNSTNYKGTTLIMYAYSCYINTGDISMLELIGSYSPNLDLKDERGLCIFDYINKDEKVLRVLSEI